ncbi:unnamed protein product [Cylicostephanus goldi]|uniref:Uncharacterized protein n=1 Tax=Cylicostephanus goldi TaxID=71465 RepID=A0A3P7QS01_CYLGO|nr:unnamed protein product [Cylicostephanus goldi]
METHVDKVKSGMSKGDGEGMGGRGFQRQSQRYCENADFGDDMMGNDQWRVEQRGGKERGGWVGKDLRHDLQKRTHRRNENRSTAEAIFLSDIEGSEGRRVGERDNGKKRRRRFDSDLSSISVRKRRRYTDREINRFQMEVLKVGLTCMKLARDSAF